MKKLLCIACLVVPGIALADGPWGDGPGCKRYLGQDTGGADDLTLFDGNSIQYFESGCEITDSESLGSDSYMLTTKCSGEGETWTKKQKIAYSADNRSVTFYFDDGGQYVLKSCR